jgi:hypothetical protein
MLRNGRSQPRERERQAACKLDGGAAPASQCCEWPGCSEEGAFRAPKSRSELRAFQYFCLAHVRLYNQNWDYFKGMSPSEIEAHRRADTIWHRPTWRFGTAGVHEFRDPFGFFNEEDGRREPPVDNSQNAQERRMMDRLELKVGFGLDELKAQYKVMAKRHHPDLHGGDKAAEERLKLINEAYSYLMENRLYA